VVWYERRLRNTEIKIALSGRLKIVPSQLNENCWCVVGSKHSHTETHNISIYIIYFLNIFN